MYSKPSGTLHQLLGKLLDIVFFRGDLCLWRYSTPQTHKKLNISVSHTFPNLAQAFLDHSEIPISKSRISHLKQVLKAANDNDLEIELDLIPNSAMIPHCIEALETYMGDLILEMVAANDNEKTGER